MWPYIGVSVFPDKGDGVYWYNLIRRNAQDYHLSHKACPVILGSKWICNKWIGYDAQWQNEDQNCGLTEDSRFDPKLHHHIL